VRQSFDRSLHNNWDRQLEGDLPDSRLSGPRRRATTVVRAGKLLELVFCASCGKSGGGVTADWAAHVFYYCDECFEKYDRRPPPGMAVADEAMEKQMRRSNDGNAGSSAKCDPGL
jgi:hypothetical protein